MELKVYQMNDYDWWADYSEDEARKSYTTWQLEQAEIPKEDIEIYDDIIEMSNETMEKFTFKDEDLDTVLTFKEELARNPKVGFFASTEY